MSQELSIRQLDGLHDIPAKDWNKLCEGSNPFVQHEYLYGLEKYDCLSNQGWTPSHLVVYSGESLVGGLPLYLRSNSYGEFVFDWAWADAYERAGGKYYPKLVTAIPFAPVIGPRLLVHPLTPSSAKIKELLIDRVIQIARVSGLSSYHCLFTDSDDQKILDGLALLPRSTCQFHWHNRDYRDFQDFLDALTSKKRKQIKRERKKIQDNNIEIELVTGKNITDGQWEIFYQFYCATFYRRWGNPRLTLEFFKSLGHSMPSSTLLILARYQDTCIAGAFLMEGKDTLYGRHWGCSSQFPYLHFELCYYQAIDYCINKGLTKLDAGVQGEHKLARGFEPWPASSYHWIQHPGFRSAIKDYLAQEKQEIDLYIKNLCMHLPYKTD